MQKPLLVVNAGSSSIKLALFARDLSLIMTGSADALGPQAQLRLGDSRTSAPLHDHAAALAALLEALSAKGFAPDSFAAVGHRIVHGGTQLTRPTRITPAVRDQIEACIPLAPLHNPHNLAAIDAMAELAPNVAQVACFDTGFHASNSGLATTYALPADLTARGLRRYGFHGISYEALTRRLPDVTGTNPRHVLACHLGNGASLCAIRDNISVATTMGYSPLEGLTMGTRCGSIDGNLVLHLVSELGLEGTHHLLNRGSGLLGLSGVSADMRALDAAGDPQSQFAQDHFCYWAARHAGSMIVAMGGCDAVVFTGGIGENAANIRAGIAQHLHWLGLRLDDTANQSHGPALHHGTSTIKAWVIPADEEREIALSVGRVLGFEHTG